MFIFMTYLCIDTLKPLNTFLVRNMEHGTAILTCFKFAFAKKYCQKLCRKEKYYGADMI